jgi:CRP-like cAMP-binding protein
VRRLLEHAARNRVREGELIHDEGERPSDLHLLLRGGVELTKLNEHDGCGLMLLTAGDLFSLAAVMADESYLTSARALGAATIVALPAAQVRKTARECPELGTRIITLLAGQWRMAVRHILDLKCRTAPQRLAALLIRLVDMQQTGRIALLPVPKRRLAARLGMAPATLSRAIQLISEEGLIVRGRQLIVRDRERIERFCERSPHLDVTEVELGVRAL